MIIQRSSRITGILSNIGENKTRSHRLLSHHVFNLCSVVYSGSLRCLMSAAPISIESDVRIPIWNDNINTVVPAEDKTVTK
jgi:hypothetical protein